MGRYTQVQQPSLCTASCWVGILAVLLMSCRGEPLESDCPCWCQQGDNRSCDNSRMQGRSGQGFASYRHISFKTWLSDPFISQLACLRPVAFPYGCRWLQYKATDSCVFAGAQAEQYLPVSMQGRTSTGCVFQQRWWKSHISPQNWSSAVVPRAHLERSSQCQSTTNNAAIIQ